MSNDRLRETDPSCRCWIVIVGSRSRFEHVGEWRAALAQAEGISRLARVIKLGAINRDDAPSAHYTRIFRTRRRAFPEKTIDESGADRCYPMGGTIS